MASSEIDDIFASKGKCKPRSTASSLEKKKQDKSGNSTDGRNRPAPEIVVDSSPSTLTPDGKSAKIGKGINSGLKTGNKDKNKDSFRDSRGSRPRVYHSSSNVFVTTTILEGRKTEDGFTIYKEHELRIGDEGGGKWLFFHSMPISTLCIVDTPACPFDCDCCRFIT
jgi:hypothetical protein